MEEGGRGKAEVGRNTKKVGKREGECGKRGRVSGRGNGRQEERGKEKCSVMLE